MCHAKECYLVETGHWIDAKKKIFNRNNYIPTTLLDKFVLKNHSKGVFCTAYTYNTEDIDNAYLYGDLYFDFDDKNNFETVRVDALRVLSFMKVVYRVKPEDVNIFFSGNKGVHLIFPKEMLGIEPHLKLNGIYKAISKDAALHTVHNTLDLRIYDNKRMFRIPGTIHEKTGLYKIPITFEELRDASHDEIKELAGHFREFNQKQPSLNTFAHARYKEAVERFTKETSKTFNIKYKGTLKYTPPCIENIIENGATEGFRNNTIAALASFYKNYGKDLQEAVQFISQWNNDKNIPATKEAELVKTVRSIYTGKANYGCSSLQTLSTCTPDTCKLKKKAGGTT